MRKEHEELNHPACSLPLGERAVKLRETETALSLLQTELRLAKHSVDQAEVRITETRLQLHNSRITARNLRNRIAQAEQELRKLLSSSLPPPSIALSRVRAERELAALREQYSKLVGEAEVPPEAA
jgi:chromosome segregation ATPase